MKKHYQSHDWIDVKEAKYITIGNFRWKQRELVIKCKHCNITKNDAENFVYRTELGDIEYGKVCRYFKT